jgi:hypothetical protein
MTDPKTALAPRRPPPPPLQQPPPLPLPQLLQPIRLLRRKFIKAT